MSGVRKAKTRQNDNHTNVSVFLANTKIVEKNTHSIKSSGVLLIAAVILL